MSNKTLSIFRNIIRNINNTPINKVADGNIIYIERFQDLPTILDIIIISNVKKNVYKSISYFVKDEIKKNSSNLKISKLHHLNNIFKDDILISQINEKKLNEIIAKLDNDKTRIRYLNLGQLNFINLI